MWGCLPGNSRFKTVNDEQIKIHIVKSSFQAFRKLLDNLGHPSFWDASNTIMSETPTVWRVFKPEPFTLYLKCLQTPERNDISLYHHPHHTSTHICPFDQQWNVHSWLVNIKSYFISLIENNLIVYTPRTLLRIQLQSLIRLHDTGFHQILWPQSIIDTVFAVMNDLEL